MVRSMVHSPSPFFNPSFNDSWVLYAFRILDRSARIDLCSFSELPPIELSWPVAEKSLSRERHLEYVSMSRSIESPNAPMMSIT